MHSERIIQLGIPLGGLIKYYRDNYRQLVVNFQED